MKEFIKLIIPVNILIKFKILIAYLKSSKKCDEIELKDIMVVDIPAHGNLGDQAIAISEIDFIKRNISNNVSYCYVESVLKYLKFLKKNLNKNTIICLHGGGNLGVEYYYYEFVRLIFVCLFPSNKLVLFPQTFDFGDISAEKNKKILKQSQSIYSKHKKLFMCAREETSYVLMKKFFPKNNIVLVRDIVLSYNPMLENEKKENKVLFCLRNDVEKNIDSDTVSFLEKVVEEKKFIREYTDTHLGENVIYGNIEDSRKAVNNKISEFQKAKLIITDRLHGMIFSYLAKTPCIVFPNSNYKVKGVYQWIKKCPYIIYIENPNKEVILNSINKLLSSESEYFNFNNKISDFEFEKLINFFN